MYIFKFKLFIRSSQIIFCRYRISAFQIHNSLKTRQIGSLNLKKGTIRLELRFSEESSSEEDWGLILPRSWWMWLAVDMLKRWFLWCCRIAYQRNDDDEEEAARERRRRARQERLRQKQEEESLGQVTDQVEANAQNRYCPLQGGESLSCFSLSPSVEWVGVGRAFPSLSNSTVFGLSSLFNHFMAILATHQIERQTDFDIRATTPLSPPPPHSSNEPRWDGFILLSSNFFLYSV